LLGPLEYGYDIVVVLFNISRMISAQILLAVVLLAVATHQGAYQKYYDEGYRIAVAMSLDQKIGQTLQVDFSAFNTKKGTDEAEAAKLHLGSLLVGGDGMPD
jgi:hypothetical protein